ncbi:putative oligopeptide transporter, OPT family [Clostridium cavendishii DSM 21758]|uniref:Putative oligopeptide transporter, OPT family n=1 Tax=Clostridium cavendishii DSM 21758 TaxID=1121302 RepID=A0A1M6UFM2_9CLOT|nr:oligopeptide transporter, OPT family [Clostridium cavendishii]SHK67977.1 putative oligopeptide transporter, OPT family [Clostridium cavendishii DSM 21758]
MADRKGLSQAAYGGVDGENYKPYISVNEALPELTIASILIGSILAAIFAAANVYLALKVGMTIAAIIPASILGTALLYAMGRKSIFEANLVAGVAGIGESLAGGIVFTLPAVVIWGETITILQIVLVTILGGVLGILFVIPLRKYLIVEEHGKLAYPESMAASEVLVNSTAGGEGFKNVATGLAGGGLFKFLSGGLLLWSESPTWDINIVQSGKNIFQSMYGIDALASLLGVGFIVGIEAATYMFSGAVIAYFGLIPLIKFFGEGLQTAVFPSTIPIAQMSASAVRGNYIRYIGAGAVAAGGFISLGKSIPIIFKSIKAALSGMGGSHGEVKRTELDLPMTYVLGAAILVFLLAWLLPMLSIHPVGAIFAVIFSFLFAVVSARICGIIGASNNPVSGMTIATLLFITAILKAIGVVGTRGMIIAILAGAIVCVATAVAGGTSQALKTTFVIGGTPKNVELGLIIGLIISAIAGGAAMLLLINIYGIGGDKGLQAPQATLMSMVVQGVMNAQLPWTLVLVGAALGIVIELLGLPVLPVALGIYLPISLSSAILIGGIIRLVVEKQFKAKDELRKQKIELGVLFSSGLVAGDALVGILVAGLTAGGLADTVGIGPKIIPVLSASKGFALFMFIVLILIFYSFVVKERKA